MTPHPANTLRSGEPLGSAKTLREPNEDPEEAKLPLLPIAEINAANEPPKREPAALEPPAQTAAQTAALAPAAPAKSRGCTIV